MGRTTFPPQSTNMQTSLGDFLSRQHGGSDRSVISTTTTTIFSAAPTEYDQDEWCLVPQTETSGILGRVQDLESKTKRLLARLDRLERGENHVDKTKAKPAILAPVPTEDEMVNCDRSSSTRRHCAGDALRRALILQKTKILSAKRSKQSRVPAVKPKRAKRRRSAFQEELACRVQNPNLRDAWHILKSRKVEDPHAAAILKLTRDLMAAKAL